MKTQFFISIIFCSFFLINCSKNKISPDTGLDIKSTTEGQSLKAIESYNNVIVDIFSNYDSYDGSISIHYNDHQSIEHITFTDRDGSISGSVDITYQNLKASRIKASNITYDIVYQGNKVSLLPTTNSPKREYTITDGYIDSYTKYLSTSSNNKVVFTFKRDQNNNIDTISVASFSPTNNGEIGTEYYYLGHNSSADVFDGYNPIYDWFIFNGSLRLTGEILNFKISNHPPTVGSKWTIYDGYHENEYFSTITMDKDGRPTQVNGGSHINKLRYK